MKIFSYKFSLSTFQPKPFYLNNVIKAFYFLFFSPFLLCKRLNVQDVLLFWLQMCYIILHVSGVLHMFSILIVFKRTDSYMCVCIYFGVPSSNKYVQQYLWPSTQSDRRSSTVRMIYLQHINWRTYLLFPVFLEFPHYSYASTLRLYAMFVDSPSHCMTSVRIIVFALTRFSGNVSSWHLLFCLAYRIHLFADLWMIFLNLTENKF